MCANHVKPTRVQSFKTHRAVSKVMYLQMGAPPEHDHDVSPASVQSFKNLPGRIESDVFTVGSLYLSTITMFLDVSPILKY